MLRPDEDHTPECSVAATIRDNVEAIHARDARIFKSHGRFVPISERPILEDDEFWASVRDFVRSD